ncbi:MAG: tRNA pseudouridine(55) synthase TruB [Candidatus Omnitrophota bacterium]
MDIAGILLVDKSRGMSSHDVVNVLRHKLKIKKIGHAGTLDPEATGLLIMLVSRATKLSDLFLNCEKTYDVQLTLGIKTTTADITGDIIKKESIPGLSDTQVREVLNSFLGRTKQIPPMYSAKKIKGEKLYNLARKGINIPRPDQTIYIYELKIKKINLPFIDFTVRCSKGTYIRTLCEDMGERLGYCAVMSGLRRTACGDYDIKQAITVENIEKLNAAQLAANIISIKGI